MPAPSVTYSFSNSTTADATQVNQNFTDLINGASDGTKDYSINALTCAGAATFNGNCTFGNQSTDDVTFTGSLASTIPVKTTATYNIGAATLGLAGIYFGANSQTVRVVGSGSMSATWTLTLPVSAGTSRFRLETDGAGVSSWQPNRRTAVAADNISLSAAVASNALTITMKSADGTDLSATNPADIAFRSATQASGVVTTRSVTSNITVTVPSTATLGHGSGVDSYIYVYAIDNAGTVELAVSSVFQDERGRGTTTAIDTASDANGFYSTTARTSVGIKLIGQMVSNQATAGTWATAIAEVTTGPLSAAYKLPTTVYENNTSTQLNLATPVANTWGIPSTAVTIAVLPGTFMFMVQGGCYGVNTALTTGIGLVSQLGTSTTPGSGLIDVPLLIHENYQGSATVGRATAFTYITKPITITTASNLYVNLKYTVTTGAPTVTDIGFQNYGSDVALRIIAIRVS